MANRTVNNGHTIRGRNPQQIIGKITRTRIYDCRYWKEECFALTSELLVDKAMELKYIGGVNSGNIKPSPFLCLIQKMLQLQPHKDILMEFIRNEEFKYVRALGAFYLRLISSSVDCYKYLSPLLNDYKKIKTQSRDGKFAISHMDEFIDDLLREDTVNDVLLPRIKKRYNLEDANEIEPRGSLVEANHCDKDLEDDAEENENIGKNKIRQFVVEDKNIDTQISIRDDDLRSKEKGVPKLEETVSNHMKDCGRSHNTHDRDSRKCRTEN